MDGAHGNFLEQRVHLAAIRSLNQEQEKKKNVLLWEALARLLAIRPERASTERAIQTAMRLLALDPLQEAVHRALMRLYARQGRRGAALKQYQVCVGALQRELGTEPEAETKQLYRGLVAAVGRGDEMTEAEADRVSRVSRWPVCTGSPHGRDGAVRAGGGTAGSVARAEEAKRGDGRVATVWARRGSERRGSSPRSPRTRSRAGAAS